MNFFKSLLINIIAIAILYIGFMITHTLLAFGISFLAILLFGAAVETAGAVGFWSAWGILAVGWITWYTKNEIDEARKKAAETSVEEAEEE